MPIDRETIERAIRAAHSDVDEVLSGHNVRIKAIQFLLPDTHHLNEIQRFLYCENETQQAYLNASNTFVYGKQEVSDTDKVMQSLYYLDFVEPFRYYCYGVAPKASAPPANYEIDPDQFDIRRNPPVPINSEDRVRLSRGENLDPFWKNWCEALRQAAYGVSTLWTYVRLRKFNTEGAISSGILVFDACLGEPSAIEGMDFRNLSAIAKRIQEALYELTLNLFKLEIEHQATRAAISQIMARNMSHNVGSHVSYKATNLAIKHRIIGLYPEKFSGPNHIGSTPIEFLNRENSIIEWIDFMSEKLDKYEIHRNEYLADFNLSPQYFRFYQDGVLPFCENTLILDNLASAEGAHYFNSRENKLKIRVFIKAEGENCFTEIKAKYPGLTCNFPEVDCNEEIVYPDHFPYLLKSNSLLDSLANGINWKIPEGTPDLEVMMHSEQGLYSILENFIRNSAKHNKEALRSSPLEVRLYLEDKGEHYSLVICDNVSQLEGSRLFNRAPNSQGLYQFMKNQIVGDEQSVRQNLGFADMNINSFLFKHRAAEIGNKSLSSNFHLVAIDGDLCNFKYTKIESSFGPDEALRKFSFGYQMELLKPRKVLWIGRDVPIKNYARKKNGLRSKGVFQYDDLKAYLNGCRTGNEEIAAFEFVVFYNSFTYAEYLKHQVELPPRVIVLQDDEPGWPCKPNISTAGVSLRDVNNVDDLIERCWEIWLGRLKKKVATYVYFEDNRNAAKELNGIEIGGGHTVTSVNRLERDVLVDNDVSFVVYDHHGRAFNRSNLPKIKTDRHNTNFYTQHTKIVFDKGSDDFVRLNQLPKDPHKKRMLAYQLIDAATTNIFVLDERIAIQASYGCPNKNDKNAGIDFVYDKLMFSRFCYGKVFALNFIRTESGESALVQSGNNQFRLTLHLAAEAIRISADEAAASVLGDVDTLSKDVLVIHRTYMKQEILGMEVRDFLNLAESIFGSVVITSGGGYPHTIKEPVRYLPFSIIHQCLGSRLAKLKLVSSLQKLRYLG